ncbi:MAG TPA: hypothetical protein VFD67_09890 [Gemmatimonadaceae bacterium]|nr:hypothetical protein [Gemmatimonadaceae bacterium]
MYRRIAVLALAVAAVTACQSTEPVAPSLTRQLSTQKALDPAPAPTETDALAISANIQALHMPYGTLADPGFASSDPASPDYNTLTTYNRMGDGAIWTGHYLAAESYHYASTQSADALAAVRTAMNGVQSLVDVTALTDPDVLARSWIPQNSQYIDKVRADEGHNGMYATTYNGQDVYWIGATSRDQYSGIFFGLAVAYDFVPDATLQAQAAGLVTRLLDYLLAHGWSVQMPDGSFSTMFMGRPDQQLALLQIGRHMNPKYEPIYTAFAAANAAAVSAPVRAECQDTYGSYFKFNLDYITLFDLVRLEPAGSPFAPFYTNAYNVLRNCTAKHQNAHFNMIDRALRTANGNRDSDTRNFLGLWLLRSRRDYFTDVSNKYAVCGTNQACDIVAVNDRPNTDFLWQRSPQLLYGGDQGLVETAGIDYLLPYWMGRKYGVISP